MNGKGQVIMVGLMLAVLLVILSLSLAYPVYQATENARTSMNCTTDFNLSMGTQAACVSTDFSLPIFIGTVLAVAGVAMLGRIYFD